MKNTLSIIQSIANHTLRNVLERESVDAFTQRLHALSGAHDVLVKHGWTAGEMGEVVQTVLQTLSSLDRFQISGPVLKLGPRAALTLSLLLHELATNALKYGALSTDRGHVTLSWRISSIEGVDFLNFDWTESNGPLVTMPMKQGFGTRLINMGFGNSGEVDLQYLPDGFTGKFTARLSELLEN